MPRPACASRAAPPRGSANLQVLAGRRQTLQVKVYIISDVRLYREGVATLLTPFPTVQVLGAGNIDDSVSALRSGATDVALLDMVRPRSRDAIGVLRQAQRRLRIVAMGIRELGSEVLTCAAVGIDGFTRMDASPGELVAEIESVMRDELVCSPKMAASLYRSIGARATGGDAALTSRELQVAELMNRGLPNKQIAQCLGVEPCTAKNHVQNILQKLKVHHRGEAVAKLRALIGERFSAGL